MEIGLPVPEKKIFKGFLSYMGMVAILVTPGSSFEQAMMGWSPQCYIPSFVEIGLSVPEKKIFDLFLPYRGVEAILVM